MAHFRIVGIDPLSRLDGMINIPIYLVWGLWVQLSFCADHIIFNNGYMKHAETSPYKEENDIIITTIKENKSDTSNNPGLLSYATTVILKFKLT